MSDAASAAGVRLGVDVVDVSRFGEVCRRQPRLIERVFTPQEQSRCRGQVTRLAVRFAAKEAGMKLLGVGLGAVNFVDIEVGTLESGEPVLLLSGRAAALAKGLGLGEVSLSLTHSAMVAIAVVAALSRDTGRGLD